MDELQDRPHHLDGSSFTLVRMSTYVRVPEAPSYLLYLMFQNPACADVLMDDGRHRINFVERKGSSTCVRSNVRNMIKFLPTYLEFTPISSLFP